MSYQGLLFIASWRNRCSGKGAGLRPGDSALTGLLRQSDSLVVCEVDPELKEKLRKFRFRKETDNAAIIMKVDKDRQMVVLEEEFQVRGGEGGGNGTPEKCRVEPGDPRGCD